MKSYSTLEFEQVRSHVNVLASQFCLVQRTISSMLEFLIGSGPGDWMIFKYLAFEHNKDLMVTFYQVFAFLLTTFLTFDDSVCDRK